MRIKFFLTPYTIELIPSVCVCADLSEVMISWLIFVLDISMYGKR